MEYFAIGNKMARVPIIQGGMGVGVSRSKLAGAVAKAGGIGIISTAQIGYDEEDFIGNYQKSNIRAIRKHIRQAKSQADGGLVGVNVMVALKDYEEHVRTAAKAGADVIICGAGLPVTLPKLVEGTDAKIAPVVSSEKAVSILLKMWERRYQSTADFIVIEGPKAGGHLGFSREQLQEDVAGSLQYEEEIKKMIGTVRSYEKKFDKKIPVMVAGGIFNAEDIRHVRELGADGVQVASRFVATEECDAHPAYKEAYLNAKEEDIRIVQSPVGMPGRAIENRFLKEVAKGKKKVTRCYGCLAKCNPEKIPYCITQALIRAVDGDVENGLIFCGANVGRIHEITTVSALMEELKEGFCDNETLKCQDKTNTMKIVS